MSQLRCRPGDLAVVISQGDMPPPENRIGKVVEVLERLPFGSIIRSPAGRIGKTKSHEAWICLMDGVRVGFDDKQLMPIRPEPQDIEARRQTEVLA